MSAPNLIYRGATVVRRSWNLRGLLLHASAHGVRRIILVRRETEGTMYVQFLNGDTTRAHFASYAVMCDWIEARWTSRNGRFSGAQVETLLPDGGTMYVL